MRIAALHAELRRVVWEQARSQAVLIVQRYVVEAAELRHGAALANRETEEREQAEKRRLLSCICDDLRAMTYDDEAHP